MGHDYGSGRDGAIAFDGVNAFPFASLVGSVYTLTSDFFGTVVTVASGVTVKGANFRGRATVSIDVAGHVSVDGAPASGSTPGTSQPQGILFNSAGNNGGATGTVGAGANAPTVLGAQGGRDHYAGAGGVGGSGVAGVGGNGGSFTVTVTNPLAGSLHDWKQAQDFHTELDVFGNIGIIQFAPGSGGGAGAGDGINPGGGGGGGAGNLLWAAPSITVQPSGSITSNGGDGGTPSAGNCGGGAGAGGGVLALATEPGGYLNEGVVEAKGGAGGPGVGTGTAGAAGSDGEVIYFK